VPRYYHDEGVPDSKEFFVVPNKYKAIGSHNANGDRECTLVFVLKIEWFVVTFPINSFW
jgi:hypothetical protein